MTNESVTNDLRSLSRLEIPAEGPGSTIVKWTLLLFTIMVLSSFVVVIFALVTSMEREDRLENQLVCIRVPAVRFDQQLGNSVGILVENNVVILKGLSNVALSDRPGLEQTIAEIQTLMDESQAAKKGLEEAIIAREKSLANC